MPDQKPYGGPTVSNQPPLKTIPNEPASTVAKALSNSKAQADNAK
jgi:hypothetical protein